LGDGDAVEVTTLGKRESEDPNADESIVMGR
jgi:hypothetical protein